jgi:hypothetical protein
MSVFLQTGTAVVLVVVTLWVQCAGIAALAIWVRRALAGGAHRIGPFRSAALVVRLTTALIALHGLLILFWASCYRLLCFASLGIGNVFLRKQLCNRWVWRCGPSVEVADVGSA